MNLKMICHVTEREHTQIQSITFCSRSPAFSIFFLTLKIVQISCLNAKTSGERDALCRIAILEYRIAE